LPTNYVVRQSFEEVDAETAEEECSEKNSTQNNYSGRSQLHRRRP